MKYGRILTVCLLALVPLVVASDVGAQRPAPDRVPPTKHPAALRFVRLSGDVIGYALASQGQEELARRLDAKVRAFERNEEELARVERDLRERLGERPDRERQRDFLQKHVGELMSVGIEEVAAYAEQPELRADKMVWPFR